MDEDEGQVVPPVAFRTSVLALASGAAAGQLALVVAGPALSRVYSPAAIGQYMQWMALLSILLTFVTFRWETALPSADERYRASLTRLAMGSLLLISTIASLLVHLSQWGSTVPLLAWLAPGLILQGAYAVLIQARLTRGASKPVAHSKAMHGLSQAIGQVALGLVTASSRSLAAGYLVGAAGGLLPLVRRQAKRRPGIGLGPTVKKYWLFAAFITWTGVTNMVGNQAPIYFLSPYGEQTVGQFGLGFRTILAPAVLVGVAVAQSLLAQIAARAPLKRVAVLARTVLQNLIVALAISLVPLVLFGPNLTTFVFGADWAPAGEFLRVLAPSILMTAVVSAIGTVPLSLGHAAGEAKFQTAILATRLGAIWIGAQLGGAMGVAVGFTVASVVTLAAYVAWCCSLLELPLRSLTRLTRSASLSLLSSGLPCASG